MRETGHQPALVSDGYQVAQSESTKLFGAPPRITPWATCWWPRATPPGALAAHRKGPAVHEALTARDSANTQWQRDLVVSLARLSQQTAERPPAERVLTIGVDMKARDVLSTVRFSERSRRTDLQRTTYPRGPSPA